MKLVYNTKNNDFSIEFWGASTKHPDSVFYFSNYVKDMSAPFNEFNCVNFFAFVIHSVSKLWFPTMEWGTITHAHDIIEKWAEYRHNLPLDDDGKEFNEWLIENYVDEVKDGYTSTYNGRYVW